MVVFGCFWFANGKLVGDMKQPNLKNMRKSKWVHLPKIGVNIKKKKPPTRKPQVRSLFVCFCFFVEGYASKDDDRLHIWNVKTRCTYNILISDSKRVLNNVIATGEHTCYTI